MNAPTKIASSLHSAMAAAFGEIEAATKSTNNPHFKSKYADIATVIDAVKPALVRHGLFFTQHPEPSERGVCIETMLHHASGESISLGKLFVPANKQDAQGFGSALTYARRYALVTAFGVPTEDDDGNAASAPVKQAEKPASTGPVIDQAQYDQLVQFISAARLTPAQFNQTMGCKTVKDLPAADFEEALERLQSRIAQLAKAETNKEAAHA